MRREITFSYTMEDLVSRLELPKDSVIISLFSQVLNQDPRQFCVKISVPEKELNKYFKKKEKGAKK